MARKSIRDQIIHIFAPFLCRRLFVTWRSFELSFEALFLF
ncbi:hypothetical protein BP354E_5762 [Burkholderia pseudomallei 354e]|nr:hypothetical protein BP354E_5762 [Burkholderia pseudomallei 354e]EIF73354.1 hypothetical protein BP354A_5751 [Burkholderia pseudomallei 354a]